MSYTSLGQPSAAEMARMAAQTAAAQAQQRHDEQQKLKEADPQLLADLKQLEKQSYQLWEEEVKLRKQVEAKRGQIAAYEEALQDKRDLQAERRNQLFIIGGAVALGAIFIVLAPRKRG